MKILLLTNQLSTGGAEQFIVRLAGCLSDRHEVVVASAGGELESALRVPHATIDLRTKRLRATYDAASELRQLMFAHGTEVVHANSPNTAIAARLARPGAGVPVIASAHGWWEDWKKPMIARGFAMGADVVVGCAAHLTEDLIGYGLPRRKARTIHNGIPFTPVPAGARAAVRAELGLEADTPVILGVGRLGPTKGFAVLIKAMALLRDRHPRARLVIAGDGPCRDEILSLYARLNLGDAVHFLGMRHDVNRLMAAADMFCLPSRIEGLPLVVPEAMAAGLPVVATAVGGVPEVITHGLTGLLVPPEDPGPMAEALARLLEAPDLARRLATAGRDHAAAHFTLEGMAGHFEALYREERARRAPRHTRPALSPS